MPAEFLATAPLWAVMPVPVCQATLWPLKGRPLLSVRASAVQLTVAPAATESIGESEVSTGGVPPINSAPRLEPLVSETVTVDHVLSRAVTFIVARPSPVAVTVHVGRPQPRVAVPLATVKITETPPAALRFGPRAMTVNGSGTPMGIVPMGSLALIRVSASPEPES
jgi:hypothetical protein